MRTNEHDLHCKRIVEDLQNYYNGLYISYNGDIYNKEDLEEVTVDYNDYYIIDGEQVDINDVEELSLYDYFADDIYNINYILDSNRELEAVRIMVACGGPNIYINTWDKKVELFWWSESGEYYLDNEICEAINDVFTGIYSF